MFSLEEEKQKGGAFMKADDARVIVWQLADVVSVTKEVYQRVTGSENGFVFHLLFV